MDLKHTPNRHSFGRVRDQNVSRENTESPRAKRRKTSTAAEANKQPEEVIVLSSDTEDEMDVIPLFDRQPTPQQPRPARVLRSETPKQEAPLVVAVKQPVASSSSASNESPERSDEEEEDDEGEYEVERVMLSHVKQGVPHFLLKWKRYSIVDCTWEVGSTLGCDDRINEFKARVAVCEIIRSRCSPAEQKFYPYGANAAPADITRFLSLAMWEHELNAVCTKAKVAPIYVENWHDDELAPPNFKFMQRNVIRQEALDAFTFAPKEKQHACNCVNGCDMYSGCCNTLYNEEFAYQGTRVKTDFVNVIECTDDCACSLETCKNRVVQRGRQVPIILFRTENRGWSVRAAAKIPRGHFVMQYCGEVLTAGRADARGNTSYQYLMDTRFMSKFVVDALFLGNEARWVNHSCDPNLKCFGAMLHRYDSAYEELAFFAVKEIEAGDELTVNYHATLANHEVLIDGEECLCGAAKCRGFMM